MNDDSGIDLGDSCDPDLRLLSEFRQLWSDAQDLWDRSHRDDSFQGYVSADFQSVYDTLCRLRSQAFTFLEWGSGLGVVTIMASRMGFDAYGVECEPELVEVAEIYAQKYQSNATFAHGSFIPDDFVWHPADAELNRTVIDLPAAYDKLDMEIRDFDVVYAFPWPDEHRLFHRIAKEYARPNSLFLSYDAREGVQLMPVSQL